MNTDIEKEPIKLSKGFTSNTVNKIMNRIIIITILLLFPLKTFGQLHEYVETEDKTFKWEKVSSIPLDDKGMLLYELSLTSQKWHNIEWRHTLQIFKPPEINSESPLVLFFVLGSEKKQAALVFGPMLAQAVSSYVVIIHDIPNQPLFGALVEDDLISYTFLQTLKTGDNSWPLLFPMVKAVVRGMDAAEEFLQDELNTDVSGFLVSGASKRGWTTWLTAAADTRVKGIIPVVYDNLNLKSQMELHIKSWGQFSRRISSYDEKSLPQLLLSGNDSAAKLASMVDPFTYLEKITVPKLIIIGTNDPYWPLDALNLYYNSMIGKPYILYLPNTGHTFEPYKSKWINEITVFFQKVDGQLRLPSLTWDMEDSQDNFKLNIISDTPPLNIKTWAAVSKKRDFRKSSWAAFPMDKENRAYTFAHKKPSEGTFACFVEVVYDIGGRPFTLTSRVWIFEGTNIQPVQ